VRRCGAAWLLKESAGDTRSLLVRCRIGAFLSLLLENNHDNYSIPAHAVGPITHPLILFNL
jgi:hypothetical protein